MTDEQLERLISVMKGYWSRAKYTTVGCYLHVTSNTDKYVVRSTSAGSTGIHERRVETGNTEEVPSNESS